MKIHLWRLPEYGPRQLIESNNMPVAAVAGRNWQEYANEQEDYRQKLIQKGVVDGSSKMSALMCRKFNRSYSHF